MPPKMPSCTVELGGGSHYLFSKRMPHSIWDWCFDFLHVVYLAFVLWVDIICVPSIYKNSVKDQGLSMFDALGYQVCVCGARSDATGAMVWNSRSYKGAICTPESLMSPWSRIRNSHHSHPVLLSFGLCLYNGKVLIPTVLMIDWIWRFLFVPFSWQGHKLLNSHSVCSLSEFNICHLLLQSYPAWQCTRMSAV